MEKEVLESKNFNIKDVSAKKNTSLTNHPYKDVLLEATPTILICDDEPRMTSSIAELLGYDGTYNLLTTNSPRHALNLVKEQTPDLLLLDINMPEMNGFDLLQKLLDAEIDIDVIFITGEDSPDLAIKALRKGVADYLRKPFEPEELCFRVKNVLRQRLLRLAKVKIDLEKLQLERQLRQSQKMEAIGTLTGGIAHDFNNVLCIILSNTELIKLTLEKDHSAFPHVEQSLSGILRARELIKQLLSFSRSNDCQLKPQNIFSIVDESLNLIRATLPTNVKIERELFQEHCNVLCDSTQMQQIIFNLCNNASHAIDHDGGCIRVSLKPVDIESDSSTINLRAGKYVQLTINDDGIGIPENIVAKIFDPYFTTKEKDKGTGMGLSVVHGIVKGFNGQIMVDSKPGAGTRFTIYLPRIKIDGTAKAISLDRRVMPRGKERILLVDDENMIVSSIEQILTSLGYSVDAYSNSDEAFTAYKTAPNSYDLLITDMTMPGLSGLELIQKTKSLNYNLPIIMMTGYNRRVTPDIIEQYGINAMIMKPVETENLAVTVRQVIPASKDRRRAPRYSASEDAVVYSSKLNKRFYLLDIGLTGMSFLHDDDELELLKDDSVSILSSSGTTLIPDIPCRHVTSACLDEKQLNNRNRRGICFNDLSVSQSGKLVKFLKASNGRMLH